jgi:hypothetical protein
VIKLKIINTILNIIITISTIIFFYIGSFVIHIATAYTISSYFGNFLGLLSFFIPVISEIIAFFTCWYMDGIFSEFCIGLLLYIVGCGLTLVLESLAKYVEERIYVKSNNEKVKVQNYNTQNNKYMELAVATMQGLEIVEVEDALIQTYEFYKKQGKDLTSINVKNKDKHKELAKLVMLGLETDDIDDAISQVRNFYK